MTAADELRTAAASIRAGDTPADPDKFLEAVAEWLDSVTSDSYLGSLTRSRALAAARAWNAELP